MEGKTMQPEYWNHLYTSGETKWDIGYPCPAIKEYIDQLPDKNISILIPGCGNAYEAGYLLAQGFSNITVIDIAPSLTAALEKKFEKQSGKQINIITGNFFEHTGNYQLILEQTFFCALDPSLRKQYANKMHALLLKGGHLTGLLFTREFEDSPPYGGSMAEYQDLFAENFYIKTLAPCYNSIERRKLTEAFINLIAK